MSDYVDVEIGSEVDAGELIGLLSDDAVLGAWEGEGVVHLYWEVRQWTPAALESLQAALARLSVSTPEISVVSVPDRDWNSRWLEAIQPVQVGRMRIRQSWNASDPSFAGIELVIDPKRAFGSGYHATTQLLLEWMEQRIRPGLRILDIGTGSGILAMATIRLGAGSALGIDNDPVAIECALENARINGFGDELAFRVGIPGEIGPEKFELVVANLDRRTLLAIRQELRKLVGARGAALVSGLLVEDIDEMARAYFQTGGTVLDRRERDEWAALEIQFG